MPSQTRVQKPRTRVEMNTGTRVEQDRREKLDAEAVKADLDELLDEIDEILEGNEEFRNTEAFVDAFRQMGGE